MQLGILGVWAGLDGLAATNALAFTTIDERVFDLLAPAAA